MDDFARLADKVGNVAGCFMVDGKATRGAKARLVRDNVVIYKSKVASLRRFKEDVKEVGNGYECGIVVANFADVKVGDVLEVFKQERIEPAALAAGEAPSRPAVRTSS